MKRLLWCRRHLGALLLVLAVMLPTSASAAPPPFGSLLATSMFSPTLGVEVHLSVYLPPGYSKTHRYPVLYLLHGVPGTGLRMLLKLDAVARVSSLIDQHLIQPLVIVAPSDGPYSGTDTEWSNSSVNLGAQWGTFVTSDLVGYVDSHFAVCDNRAARAIGGLSMGAFGAMNDALQNLQEFGAVTLWSPYFVANTPAVLGPTGSSSWLSESPLLYVSRLASALHTKPLRISFYDAADDLFYQQNLAFAHLLSSLHLAYHFRAVSGPHTYTLWSQLFSSELTWLSSGEHC